MPTFGYSSDIGKIPNGRNIPCPSGATGCQSGMCLGSGHQNSDGTQACGGSPMTNQFGSDISSVGRDWSQLCRMDSDKDGKTNGDELGDPCCIWSTSSSNPRRSTLISHPSVASDVTSAPSCLLNGAASQQSAPALTSSATSINIQWTLPTTDCHCGFFVFRKAANATDFTIIGAIGPDTVSFQDSNVSPNTEYTYYVTASNLAGNSTQGNTSSITTTAPIMPAAGIAPTLVAATDSNISLTWSPPSDNGDAIVGYILMRDDRIIAYNGTEQSFTDAGLAANTQFSYKVAAFNSYGLGSFSEVSLLSTNAIGATVVFGLQAPHVVNGSDDFLIIGWDFIQSHGATILGYSLEMASTAAGERNALLSFSEIFNGNSLSVEVRGLSTGVDYFFQYHVINTIGASEASPVLGPVRLWACPGACSGHGTCEPSNQTCFCDSGFKGDDCSQASMSADVKPEDYANTVALTSSFNMYWNIEDDEIEIALKGSVPGYLSIGFADSGQNERTSDIIVGWVSNGTVQVFDYFDHDRSSLSLDETNGKNSILAFNGKEENGETSLKFRRKLQTGDDKDRDISEGTINVLYALSEEDPATPDAVPRHKGGSEWRGWTKIDFFTGKTVDISRNLIRAHGILMTAATLFFLLAMIRRYLGRWMGRSGVMFHYFLTSAAIVCAIAGLLTGIWAQGHNFSSVHLWLGMVIVAAFFVFPPLGIYADQAFEKVMFFPHYFHRIFERFAVYAAIGNGALGLKNYKEADLLFIIFLAVFGALIIIHEIGFFIMFFRKKPFEQRRSKRISKAVNCTLTKEMFLNKQLEEGAIEKVPSKANLMVSVSSFYKGSRREKNALEMSSLASSYANVGLTNSSMMNLPSAPTSPMISRNFDRVMDLPSAPASPMTRSTLSPHRGASSRNLVDSRPMVSRDAAAMSQYIERVMDLPSAPSSPMPRAAFSPLSSRNFDRVMDLPSAPSSPMTRATFGSRRVVDAPSSPMIRSTLSPPVPEVGSMTPKQETRERAPTTPVIRISPAVELGRSRGNTTPVASPATRSGRALPKPPVGALVSVPAPMSPSTRTVPMSPPARKPPMPHSPSMSNIETSVTAPISASPLSRSMKPSLQPRTIVNSPSQSRIQQLNPASIPRRPPPTPQVPHEDDREEPPASPPSHRR